MRDELEVLLYGHPTLRRECDPVEQFDDGLRQLVAGMGEAMRREQGIGLAAPQVGDTRRVLIAEDRRGGGRDILPLVNPEITFHGEGRDRFTEGCLSLPEIFADVERPVRIRVRYQDLHGDEQELEDDGLLARIVQHEADHLDGVLFVDHLSMVRRRLIAKKLKALGKQAQLQVQAGL